MSWKESLNGPERFLENSGFDVTGEVCGCDLVAPPPDLRHRRVRLRFNLDLALRGWIGQRHVTKSGSALRGRRRFAGAQAVPAHVAPRFPVSVVTK
jgi:hypothetical protein